MSGLLLAYWGTMLAGTWQHVQAGLWLLALVAALLMVYDIGRGMIRDRRRRRRR